MTRTNDNAARFWPASRRLAAFLLLSLLLCGAAVAQDKSAERGFRPGGSYAVSDIETISATSGNLMLRVPLGGLPAGRGGMGASVTLLYNSKLWDSYQETAFGSNGQVHEETRLRQSPDGGWRYAFRYGLGVEFKHLNGGLDQCSAEAGEDGKHIYRVMLILPDGGKHAMHLDGGREDTGGYANILPDGTPSCDGISPETGTLVYFSTDGTFLRLEVEHDQTPGWQNNPWTLYLPDGGRVTGGGAQQRIHDRNGNYVDVVDGTHNGHAATFVNDQVGRSVIVEYNSAANQDSVHARGTGSELLTWTVQWATVQVNKTLEVNSPDDQELSETVRVVTQVGLPSQAGGLSYSFAYNAGAANPSHGWGEVSSATLPSGARVSYQYRQDGAHHISTRRALMNHPTRKDLVYRPEYDLTTSPSNTPCDPQGETCVTETWTYSMDGPNNSVETTTVIGPDGGVTKDYLNRGETGTAVSSGLSYKTEMPDGTLVERVWHTNEPHTQAPIFPVGEYANPYVKLEFTSVRDAAGYLTKTAVREYEQDKNGNSTLVKEYDWVPYNDVPRNGVGRPYAAPPGATPKRVSVSAYYNPTPDASDLTTADPDVYHLTSSPQLKRAAESSEVRDGGGAAFSRSEFTYDDPATTGNLTEQRSWDSTRGALQRPLASGTFVSMTHEYDDFGNRTLTSDAGRADGSRTQTRYVYGPVNGHGGLYPTEVVTAFGTPLARTARREYDFWMGAVTRSTDADNNVSTLTAYDVFGRPTLVRAAEGKPEETRTRTEFSDSLRRVTVFSDLDAAGDEKLVSVQHYDQLGRGRLTRQIEDASVPNALTGESVGVKVQTRYTYSGTNSFTLTSNPYRAATVAEATGEPEMGWTRSKSDNTGRHREIETFEGAGLPAPWHTNAASTGKVLTDVAENTKTVTDQAGRRRQGASDALGRMTSVVEDPGGQGLVTDYTFDVLDSVRKTVQGVQTRYFMYDSLRRVVRARQPEHDHNASLPPLTDPVTQNSQWSVGYSYDGNGNTTSTTDPRGVTTSGTYDALNRLTLRDYSDQTPDVTFTYDDPAVTHSRGALTRVLTGDPSSPLSVTRHTAFDALGRVLSSEQATGGQTYTFPEYTYNRAGALKSQTYPSGRVVEFGYDADGDLSLVAGKKDASAAATLYASEFSYTAAGAVERVRLGNGRWESAQFNSRLQVKQIGLGTAAGDTSLLKLEMSYGAAAENNGSLREQKISYAGLTQPMVQAYAYDALNRLESAAETYDGGQPSWKQTFTYDRYGNRRFDSSQTTFPNLAQQPEKSANPAIDAATNRLVADQNGDGVPDYDYDPAGNLTRDAVGRLFAYDAEGRMRSFGVGGSNDSGGSYSYDGQGRRVRKVAGLVETVYVYDAFGRLAAEYENAAAEPNGTRFVTPDHLGSPRVVTDAAGVVSRHDYAAFGDEVFDGAGPRTTADKYGSDDGLRQQFTGYERDGESELDFAQARYYNSRHGRFTSPDPLTASATLRDPQSFNRYSYALNSPYKFTDPLGLMAWGPASVCGQGCRGSDEAGVGGGSFAGAFDGGNYSAGGEEEEQQQQNTNPYTQTTGNPADAAVDARIKEILTDGKNGIVIGADAFSNQRNKFGKDSHYQLADGTLHTVHVLGDEAGNKIVGVYAPKAFSQIAYVGGHNGEVTATNPGTGEILGFAHVAVSSRAELRKNNRATNDKGSRLLGNVGGPNAPTKGNRHVHVTYFASAAARAAAKADKSSTNSRFGDFGSRHAQLLRNFRTLVP